MNDTRLKNVIDIYGVTIESLAKGTGISNATMYRYVNGNTKITFDNALKIGRFLKLSNDDIIKLFESK